jgi:hypothetical protein
MYRLLFVAAVLFLGRYALHSLGAARTAAILNRLFWVCYSGWAALVLYGMVWTPLHTLRPGHATLADIDWGSTGDWQDVTPPAPPPTRTNEFGDVAVAAPPASKQKQQGQYTATDLAPDQPASTPAQMPVDWKMAFSLLAAPLLLWVAVIFIVTGRPVWRVRQS